MIKEFKEFVIKGNVMDLAVGVIIGGAFGTIVTSLVNDVIMPVISLITGGIDFSGWFISLNGQKYATLAEAEEAGAYTSPVRVAYREGSKLNDEEYMTTSKGWDKFVDPAFEGSAILRAAVKKIFEENYGLLWYPIQYEGLEASPNIVYIGAAPNQ